MKTEDEADIRTLRDNVNSRLNDASWVATVALLEKVLERLGEVEKAVGGADKPIGRQRKAAGSSEE